MIFSNLILLLYLFRICHTQLGAMSGSPLDVIFDLYYLKLISLDAERQLLSLCLQLKTFWQDPRLSWNMTEFSGLDDIFVAADVLWIPDTQVGNA
ncbi:unnamed protein product, partial [Mesorhabditis belari]|uniref:Neurotransmitter-gated ion-channel ligand-binding domain-containing protein n=1 Tax=Mesorhabditis belari TaxID=2138241 RepID=A0AAF3J552_9BILA